MTDATPIPPAVVDALEAVRASGECNMIDRSCVMAEISKQNTHESAQAYMWLHAAEQSITTRSTRIQHERYAAALDALGERRKAGTS